MANQYDLIVIGGGSGGVRAARLSAHYGARVALVEASRMGGTCVIRGCIPKKLFAYASRFPSLFEVAPSFGWTVSASFDWPTLRANKDGEIARLEAAYAAALVDAGVTIFSDRAELTGPQSVRLVTAGAEMTADRILIATGGHPIVPEIEGAGLAITSNEAFDLETLPESLLIVGGGYVAAEFASIFHGLGVKVTISYRREKILRGFDGDLRAGLSEAFAASGIDILINTQPLRLTRHAAGIAVVFEHGHTANYGAVMFATGRAPNTAGLGLDKVGVLGNARGAIEVDEWSQSSIQSIFAIGDVTDRLALTPVAIAEGAAFAETEYNGNPVAVDHRIVPTAIFCEPEVATVGLSQEDAVLHHDEVDVYLTRFRPMLNSMSGRPEKVMIKLVVERATGQVLGVHVLGRDAAEIVQLAAIPVTMGASKADFDRAFAVHPTTAEEMVTLREPSYRLVKGRRG
ncbi:MAG: glutathione-disulfide reductase [Cucumibacter sp.]